MNFNQELYRQFIQSKMLKRQNTLESIMAHKKKQILKKFSTVPDDQVITLQNSIGLLKEFQIIQELESENDILNINIMQKNRDNLWKRKQFEINECRLLMHLWEVIQEDSIEARQFKEIIMLMLDNDGQERNHLLCELFGERASIQQLVKSWDAVMHQQCSLSKEKKGSSGCNSQEISDISIIKSKNQGSINDNKENMMNLTNSGIRTAIKSDGNKFDSYDDNSAHQKHIFQKSFHKRNRSILQKSGSLGKMSGYRSQNQTQKYLIGLKPIDFFQSNQIMTVDQEKRLVDRLYNNDMYKRREQAKKQIQQERIRIELGSCTFKPNIAKNSRAMSKSKLGGKQIKGYEKAIQRMKCGYKKNKQMKQNLQYRMWKEVSLPTDKNRQFCPPKFLSRMKQPQVQLFIINYEIGRHNIKVRVKETDRINDIVQRIGKIYSLRQLDKKYIRQSLQEEINKYYQEKVRKQAEEGLVN